MKRRDFLLADALAGAVERMRWPSNPIQKGVRGSDNALRERQMRNYVWLLLILVLPTGVYAGPFDDDLTFPASPEPFGYAKASKMFKPQGDGPFPAIVMFPTCSGHRSRHVFDVWANAALQRGYAVLVVDPLTPRGVTAPGENCRPPSKVDLWRLRKDAFDAAAHLRKQPFVDPNHIGLLGLSQGAMAGLGIAASLNETPQGQPFFKAIVSNYPVCFLGNLRIPGRPPRDINFVPEERITVPLLVQMGDLDNEGPPRDCISRLQVQKDKGSPIEMVVYKGATHGWDIGSNFTWTAANGQRVTYRYNPKVTADSVKHALDFFDQHVRVSGQSHSAR